VEGSLINEDEIERLRRLLFERGAMADPPCFNCGYNVAGYFQPLMHSCALRHNMPSEDQSALEEAIRD